MNLAKDSGKQKLTGVQKAAILFITLGPEASAGILKKLPEVPFCLPCHSLYILILQPFGSVSYPAKYSFGKSVVLTH